MRSLIYKLMATLFLVQSLMAARFLFDYTKNETAGNADWIIDRDYPYPQPTNPSSPEDWDGAISSWGYALHAAGHEVVTLPPDSEITYGTSSPLDLSNFDVFVMVEPQNPLSSSEIQAIVQFVQNGGGFFMISDHNASDRDNDGWDSPRVFNAAFEDVFGVHFDTTGEGYNSVSGAFDNVSSDPYDSIIHGPFGDVDTFGYWQGTVILLRQDINSSLKGHVWYTGEPEGSNQRVIIFTGTYGNGRIAGFGDSSPCDDGTGDPEDALNDNWDDYQDSVAILNISLWLASSGSTNNPPVIDTVIQNPISVSDTDTVSIYAVITDDHAVETDSLYLRINSGPYTAFYHEARSNDTSYFTILPQSYDDTVYYFIIAVDDSDAKTVSDTFSYVVYNHAANNPPLISSIWHEPSAPTDTDSVVVHAIITDDYGIETDSIYISVNNGSYSPLYHLGVSNDTFTYSVGKYSQGTQISYFVIAVDDSGARSVSDTLSYTVSSSQNQLNAGVIINEIMYNPASSWGDDSYYEYTEVWNATPDTVDMSGWYLMDNTPGKVAHVPPGTKVPPYHFVVFARNVDSLLSKTEYQPYLTDGDEIFINIVDSVQLSNGGEWVKLVDSAGNTVDSVLYDDRSPWPTAPDGGGPSLELKDPNIDNNDPTNWAASGSGGKGPDYGTPGDTNSVFSVTIIKEQLHYPAKTTLYKIMRSEDFVHKYLNGNAVYSVFDVSGKKLSNASSIRRGIYFVITRRRQIEKILIIK